MNAAASPDGIPRNLTPPAIRPDRAKLEALAEFAAGAGHEINNPLATIIGRAQLLLKEEKDPQRRQMLASIGAQAYRIRDMIGDVMLFGRPPRPERTVIDLHEVVGQIIAKLASEFAQDNCQIVPDIPKQLMVSADPVQLAIVFSELLRNARQAMLPAGGTIRIDAVVTADRATIKVSDHGKGFTATEVEHAFDPFFSGRQAGRGLGFGLCKCWRIMDLHGGTIEIHSAVGGPTTVQIEWPLASLVDSVTNADDSGND